MGIFIKPMDRIRRLERENARLRALVGEAAPVEPVEGEMPTVVSDWVTQAQEELNRLQGLTFEVVDGDLIVRM